jgi:glycosyltransferase involved in cell wall biosynthesis
VPLGVGVNGEQAFEMVDDADRPVLDAVLPLLIDDAGRRDLARATIQAQTLRRFFNRQDLLRVHVVGRAEELEAIAEALQPYATPWLRYLFWDERVALGALNESEAIGWYKQQIIKMAVPEWLGAPFWLTLDADVICTKPVGVADLLPGGRALSQGDVIDDNWLFAKWAVAVRSVLGNVSPPLSYGISITPLIYAAPIMQAALAMIEFANARPWKEALLDTGMHAELKRRGEETWAENLFYHTAAVRSGLLRQYHALCGIDTPHRVHGGGIWSRERWPDWDAARAFDRTKLGFFEVCNSYTGVPPEFIAEKIAPFLREDEPGAPAPAPAAAALEDDGDENAPAKPTLRVRVISRDPLIVLGPYDSGISSVVSRGMLAPVRDRRATVIVTLPACHEDPRDARRIVARIARRKREAPLHDFVVFCNTAVELELFRQFGVACYQLSHNALINERPFAIAEPETVEFDAVYNAAFHPIKRHPLAAEVKSLALIYAPWHDDPAFAPYIEESRRVLSHAAFLNKPRPEDSYRFFGREEVARQMSRARVGLCLSGREGAMRASIEYLHLGLPVVSTFATGGRDEFFDADFCAIVPPRADAVAGAVRDLVERRLPRDYVRKRTWHKVAVQRERFIEAVMRLAQASGRPLSAPLALPWLDEEFSSYIAIEEFHARIV